ncbi:MAG: AMP-binding protein [Shimia sp.]
MANPLYDALYAPHTANPAPFLVGPEGAGLSFADFVDGAHRMAGVLVAAGARPGDRVAVQVSKSAEAVMLTAACSIAGVVLLPLNPAYTARELDYFVVDAEPAVLVLDPGSEFSAPESVAVLTLAAHGEGTLMTRLKGRLPVVSARPDDLAAILYTSGTTGRPKGAMLTHDNLLSNARTLTDLWRFTAEDTLLHALPIFHTHGLFVALNVALLAGARVRFFPRFDAAQLVASMPGATTMMGVPTFYTRLLAEQGLAEAAGGMRLFISGSAPLLAETHARWERVTGHRILERYGMTELNMATSNPYDGPRIAGTVGLPLPGVEVRVDADGADAEDGEAGILHVRGPNVCKGYWRNPAKTAEDLSPDGWFNTGDIGTRDAEGYIRIVGRAKDLIISGGFNIHPKEVEEVLDAHPGVVESAVIGVPHPDLGEAAVAVIVRAEVGLTEDQVLVAAGDLARFKQPRAVRFLEALPRNAMGKVQKADLRSTYADLFVTAP